MQKRRITRKEPLTKHSNTTDTMAEGGVGENRSRAIVPIAEGGDVWREGAVFELAQHAHLLRIARQAHKSIGVSKSLLRHIDDREG